MDPLLLVLDLLFDPGPLLALELLVLELLFLFEDLLTILRLRSEETTPVKG